MDDHNFIYWSSQCEETNYDEIIENDAEIDDLNDIVEEQVEGYEEVNMLDEDSGGDQNYYIDEHIIPERYDTQANLIYLTDDGIITKSSQIGVGISHLIEQKVEEAENKIIGDQDAQEEYTAEVITEEDWIQSQGEELVPVAMEQIVTSENYPDEDIVPLQTDQDEYTTQRPYPCDFCSRRFRKKANLMNHMVAHQNVRPHICNLCGSRYVRKNDLHNHLKIHAYNIEEIEQIAEASTTGGKKKPKYDDLDFLNQSYDDIPPEDDDDRFDYNHYSKISSHIESPNSKSSKVLPKIVATKKSQTKKQTKSSLSSAKQRSAKNKSIDDSNILIENENLSKSKLFKENTDKFPMSDSRKPFVCQHCGVAFTREKALESHLKYTHGNQEPSFDCEICGDSFFDNASLDEHLEMRHDYFSKIRKTKVDKSEDEKIPFQSQLIDFDDSNSEYEPDKKDDIDDEDDDYDEYNDSKNVCDKCNMKFENLESLKKHIKTHIKVESSPDGDQLKLNKDNSSAEGNSCDVCGESFSEALDLLAHAEIHARFQPFKCLLCGETFFEENKIKMHLMENHRNEMTESSCKLCGKQCRDQRSLIKHSWEHSREKNHSCSKCGKTFHNKARLKRHISSHRNKSVVCEICHEEFSDGRQLSNHRHSHTKSNQFPCTECGKTFGSRSSQQIHIRIHTGERPYQCRFCWKAFADGGTLRKHERIHTGEKPYCCLVCPRAFNQRVVLREHIRSHHSAPDPNNGTPLTPFYCTLCGDLFSVSMDLIHHLIEHSDRSTAAKRVQPTGPRKYKRRRKLSDDGLLPLNDGKYAKVQSQSIRHSSSDKVGLKKGLLTASFESCIFPENIVEFQLPDDILQTISRDSKILSKKINSSCKPKMIYTEKARIQDRKRKKTRSLIHTHIINQRIPNQKGNDKNNDDENSNGSETCSNEDDPNEDVLHTLLKRERKLSEKFTIDLVNDLQEILRSPIKTSINIEEEQLLELPRRTCRQTLSQHVSSSEKDPNKITVKQEWNAENYTCEICGTSFTTRDKLLCHVPIHI